jgi:hypothetical protein
MGQTVIELAFVDPPKNVIRISDHRSYGPFAIGEQTGFNAQGGIGDSYAIVWSRVRGCSPVPGHDINTSFGAFRTGPDMAGPINVGSQATARWEPAESGSGGARPPSGSIA